MDLALDNPVNSGAPAKRKRRHRRWAKDRTAPQLLTRSELDGRTNAAKMFDSLASSITQDLGGYDELSTIERSLVEGFVGATIVMQSLNFKLALGQEIDLGQHAQACSAMVKIASRLGLQRRAKNIGPSLGDVLRQGIIEQQNNRVKP